MCSKNRPVSLDTTVHLTSQRIKLNVEMNVQTYGIKLRRIYESDLNFEWEMKQKFNCSLTFLRMSALFTVNRLLLSHMLKFVLCVDERTSLDCEVVWVEVSNTIDKIPTFDNGRQWKSDVFWQNSSLLTSRTAWKLTTTCSRSFWYRQFIFNTLKFAFFLVFLGSL